MGAQITTGLTIINSLLGFQAVSLTNFTTSAESAIAAGSKVEIGGSFFTFASAESITGFSSITTAATAYIELTPAGSAGSQTVSAAWTETEPVWRADLQGWYASAASIVRTIGGAYKESTSGCEKKFIYGTTQEKKTNATLSMMTLDIGDWNMDTVSTVYVDHPFGSNYTVIRKVSATIRTDEATGGYPYTLPLDYAGYCGLPGSLMTKGPEEAFVLARDASSIFDGVNYNATSYNRGWVIVWYEA